ncbi:unnamed protein product [Durusdinium trenchii]|uniref:Uncharacterized protein n=1 Tax=Durusdinium trenchii TaxID=1381693 RepID=A0ABP0PT57_9DINO
MGQCSACYEGLEALWQRDLPAPNSGSVRLPWRRWRPRHVAHERNAARAQRHWGKLRALVWAQIAFRLLLQELRIREVCRLYDEDWSEVGTPSLRRPSLNWRKVQALASTSAAALQELLNEVRCSTFHWPGLRMHQIQVGDDLLDIPSPQQTWKWIRPLGRWLRRDFCTSRKQTS